MNTANRQEYLQELATRYLAEYGPADRRTIAAWAIRNKFVIPDEMDIIDSIAAEMAQAMRTEYYTDPQGRKVRKKYSIRQRAKNEWGEWKQLNLWADFDTASEEFMQLHFQQRRRHILGECRQMKNDTESYNENREPSTPVQCDFNFTLDLAEEAASATHPDFEFEEEDGEDEPL